MARRITEVSAADGAMVVDLVCMEIDNARERVTTEASWEALEEFFHKQLVHERVLPSTVIVAWAEAGHPAAHRAVRRYAREMGERSQFDQMLVTVRAYALKTAEQPFVPYPRGRHVVQNMMRDVWLPAVVQNLADGTGLEPTRQGGTTAPSAAFFCALAMKKRGIKLGERQINRIYWRRHKLAAELEASMPLISSTFK